VQLEANIVMTIILTAIGTGIAVMAFIRNRDKDNIQQARLDGEEKGFFGAKLDGIEKSITAVGKEITGLENKLSGKLENVDKTLTELRERVVAVESKASSAHKRIDDWQG
jgi:ABC-type Fe3+-hydroxamate transport system substrate-binding protein